MLRTATGRDKSLTAASFSDLKNYLAGVKGAKFRVKARGKWHTIEDLKIRLATPGLRDALTAAMYAEARDCLREGLQPERRTTTTAAAPAWNVQSFNSAPRRERAANSDAPPPGTLLPEIKRERICWTAEEEKALRAAMAEHGDDWPAVHAHASGVLHAKRTRQDCKVKARLLAAKDAGLEEEEEEEEEEDEAEEAEDADDADEEEPQDDDGEA
jgi:plasmid stability protein